MKPACLPEQLLCRALGLAPFAAKARLAASLIGQWMPHSRQPTSCPALASMDLAAATCSGSPTWEAQASAISSSVRPYLSAMPLSTKGRACSALTAERGKTRRSTSPIDRTAAPSASTTETLPLWRDSTRCPRVTSTRKGLFINAPIESGGVLAALTPEVKGVIVSKAEKILALYRSNLRLAARPRPP